MVHEEAVEAIIVGEVSASHQDRHHTVVILGVEANRVVEENEVVGILTLRVAHCVEGNKNYDYVMGVCSPK